MSQESKSRFRRKFLQVLRNQSPEDRQQKSRVIQEKLFASEEFQKAQTVLFYASFDGEVVTSEMIKKAMQFNKKAALPVILRDRKTLVPALVSDADRLIEGPYGIKQPQAHPESLLDPEDLDLVIVPGVAFDRLNNRLGRGAGYYDRFLQDLPSTTPTIGLAFDFQVVDRLPDLESHDIRLTRIITN